MKKTDFIKNVSGLFTLFIPLLLSCEGTSTPELTEQKVRVRVTHLNADETFVLQNNGGNNLTIDTNGIFSFSKALAVDEDYEITVATQPDDQTCVVTDGEGTIGDSSPIISVACGKVIFVTDASTSGDIGGVTGADAKCMADANKPDDSKTYKAILASGVLRRACLIANCTSAAENTDWVLTPNTTYVRSTNTIIGTTNDAAIFDLSINTLLNSFKSGTAVNFWTGVISDWRSYVGHCNNWTEGTSGANSVAGVSDAIDNTAITVVPLNCSVMDIHLLCAEQ